jgi:hypothetical protein
MTCWINHQQYKKLTNFADTFAQDVGADGDLVGYSHLLPRCWLGRLHNCTDQEQVLESSAGRRGHDQSVFLIDNVAVTRRRFYVKEESRAKPQQANFGKKKLWKQRLKFKNFNRNQRHQARMKNRSCGYHG